MIRFAEESMRGQIRALWQECFGDSNEYVDLFLQSHDICRQTMVFIDGEHPVSMLSLLPITVVTGAGIMPARYVYAVATKEFYRGRGLSSALLEAAHKQMKAAGVKLSVLVPASAELYQFYGRRGYDASFYAGSSYVSAEQIPEYDGSFAITDATPQEFMQIRERAFAGRTMFVRWDGDALAYRLAETAFAGGETLTLNDGQTQAVAVCRNQNGIVTVKELALDGMPVERALGILQRKFNAGAYRLHLAMDIESPYPLERTVSGAACWYDADARERALASQGKESYINLVLD